MSAESTVRFSELVGLLERISKLKKLKDKQDLLKRFIAQWRNYESKVPNAKFDDNSFFPVMRLILPHLDKSRPAYGVRKKALARIYCNLLCLDDENPDAKRLINYKLHKYDKHRSGDFSEIVYSILKERCPFKGDITIQEVNNRLDKISETDVSSKKDNVNENLMYLLQNMKALDQKWLIRIILKDLHLGLSANQVFKTYHPSSEEFYNITNDLEAVCVKFKEASTEIATTHTFNVQVNRPLKPMLSERGDPRHIIHQLEGQEYLYETKLDGERVQVHKDGDMYRYWSRSGLEWTSSYGSDVTWGTLTPHIHHKFLSTVRNCILDGEMMGYDKVTQKMGSKTDDFDVKRPNVEEVSGYAPCYIAFDVLLLNDESLIGRSVRERREILDNEVLESEEIGKIQLAKWKVASTREECLQAFNEAVSNCEEGLMVKRLDSVYKANARKAGWFKMKPDYILGLHEELDCVIVGGYYGGGRYMNAFLCAVRDGDKFVSFTRVGTGFTRKVLYEFNTRMRPHWVKLEKDTVPDWLVLTGRGKDRPDMVIEPKNSFVVQLKAAEITESRNYATGSTLRFCRIDRFREDKHPVDDCMTIQELEDLRTQFKGKLMSRPLEINSDEDESMLIESNSASEKKQSKRKYERPQVMDWLKSTVPNKKIKSPDKSSLFQGKEFCVSITGKITNGNTQYFKKDFEEFIYNNGGVVVQNPKPSTFAVIPDKITMKIKNLIQSNCYDIVKPDWLISCIASQSFSELTPSHFICMRQDTRVRFDALYDQVGDSYTNEMTPEQLREFLGEMDVRRVEVSTLTHTEKSRFLDSSGLCSSLSSCFLAGCVVYMSGDTQTKSFLVSKMKRNRLRVNLELRGARIVDNCYERDCVTHVVLDPTVSRQEIVQFHKVNESRLRRFYIVWLSWVEKCLETLTRVQEAPYLVPLTSGVSPS